MVVADQVQEMVVADHGQEMVVVDHGQEMEVAEDDLVMVVPVLPEDGLATVVVPDNDLAVGDRSKNLKFSTHHQDQSMESSSNDRERSASTYPCRSRAEEFKRTGLMESYSS